MVEGVSVSVERARGDSKGNDTESVLREWRMSILNRYLALVLAVILVA